MHSIAHGHLCAVLPHEPPHQHGMHGPGTSEGRSWKTASGMNRSRSTNKIRGRLKTIRTTERKLGPSEGTVRGSDASLDNPRGEKINEGIKKIEQLSKAFEEMRKMI